MTHGISISNLTKSFNHSEVFNGFNLTIKPGQITAIFGPNGSGKSTLLNILSGMVKQDAGQYRIEDFDRFQFSYVFQNYRESLLPWRTNLENLALPLEIQGLAPQDVRERIRNLQDLFEFNIDWHGHPYELSGGQQQILAFMRALVTNPRVLFIDESYSALDYENNLKLRDHLQTYYLAHKPTVVFITHNIEEAVHLASEIVVFSKKPTHVLETITNPLPYPRTVESLKTATFHEVKDQVLTAFQKAANL
ncbi:MAG: ABC transporter ATP-binding protein [Candidatus Paceibacterota bacterium]